MTKLTKAQEKFFKGREKFEVHFSPIREQQIKDVEELSKIKLSEKELDDMIAEMFEVHGQKNPNKPRSKS